VNYEVLNVVGFGNNYATDTTQTKSLKQSEIKYFHTKITLQPYRPTGHWPVHPCPNPELTMHNLTLNDHYGA